MASSGSKSQLASDMQVQANALIPTKLALADITNMYFKNGFNSGGANPIVDADVAGFGLTAAKVASFITMCQQMANFFGNAAVTTGDYESTLQQVRTT